MTCLVGGVLEVEGSGSRRWGGRGGNSLLGLRYTIVLLKSVIKEGLEDFIKHAIRVEINNEGLFEDVHVLNENFIVG